MDLSSGFPTGHILPPQNTGVYGDDFRWSQPGEGPLTRNDQRSKMPLNIPNAQESPNTTPLPPTKSGGAQNIHGAREGALGSRNLGHRSAFPAVRRRAWATFRSPPKPLR